ncbi:MAG: prepilin-type N-terminal cleavage/methylation domain-containing protein [Terriglobia bacterium]
MMALQSTIKVKRSKKNRGFSLIELLIAMALLLIMAAIAVPNYLAALSRANEASATSSVRAVISAENLYRNTYGYFTALPSLGAEYLTDSLLANGSKSGYRFNVTPGSGSSAGVQFTVDGTPALSIGPSATGFRHYYGDQSAVIRFSLTGAADSASPPI